MLHLVKAKTIKALSYTKEEIPKIIFKVKKNSSKLKNNMKSIIKKKNLIIPSTGKLNETQVQELIESMSETEANGFIKTKLEEDNVNDTPEDITVAPSLISVDQEGEVKNAHNDDTIAEVDAVESAIEEKIVEVLPFSSTVKEELGKLNITVTTAEIRKFIKDNNLNLEKVGNRFVADRDTIQKTVKRMEKIYEK